MRALGIARRDRELDTMLADVERVPAMLDPDDAVRHPPDAGRFGLRDNSRTANGSLSSRNDDALAQDAPAVGHEAAHRIAIDPTVAAAVAVHVVLALVEDVVRAGHELRVDRSVTG